MPTPEKHALLSPSSSHRWLICTPSAMLESYEPNEQSSYAKEGTEAHALAELMLNKELGYIAESEYNTKLANFQATSEFYNTEFKEYVEEYVAEIKCILTEDYKNKATKVFLEERVSFEDIVPEGSGTSDVVIVGQDFIHIVDLKFGKGVAVSAINNPQLRLYALGAVSKHIRECICKEVAMTIIQPRLNEKSTDILSIQELNDWAINYVKPRALLAYEGKGELVPGEHCKFCKRKGKCKVLADKQLEIAQAEFNEVLINDELLDPSNMSPDFLAKILQITPRLIEWFDGVAAYAKNEAINNGLKLPGYKLVEGRSTRIIYDQKSVIDKLKNAGFSEDLFIEKPKLLGITSLEKNIGKKLFNDLCGDYIVKPAGKPVLVPEEDKRPAIEESAYKLIGQEFIEDEEIVDNSIDKKEN